MIENLYMLIENMCIITCLYALYEKKFRLDIATMSVVVANLMLVHLVNEGKLEPTATLLSYAIIFVYSLIEFSGKIRQTIINNILYMMVISLLQLISSMLMIVVVRFIDNPSVIAIFINIIVMMMMLLLRRKIGKLSQLVCASQTLSLISMLTCFVMLALVLLKYKVKSYVSMDMYIMIIVFIALVAVLMRKWYESRLEVKRQQMELEMSKIYGEAFEGLLSNVRKQQHDINNHLNAIYSQHYVSANYEELVQNQKEYCKYIEDSFRFSNLLRIGMPVLEGFLYGKFQDAYNNGIDIVANIDITENRFDLPIYELVSVLGILIDNAVEKAEQLEVDERKIYFCINEENDKTRIVIRNISEYIEHNELLRMFDEGVSSKGEYRGVGLNIVKEKAGKYGYDIAVKNEEYDNKNWIKFELIFYSGNGKKALL